jgi:prophage regulatory protein
MSIKLISASDLRLKGISYSKPHLWRLERGGKFPKRVPIGAGRYAYVETEIDDWIEARVRQRDETIARLASNSPEGSPV